MRSTSPINAPVVRLTRTDTTCGDTERGGHDNDRHAQHPPHRTIGRLLAIMSRQSGVLARCATCIVGRAHRSTVDAGMSSSGLREPV